MEALGTARLADEVPAGRAISTLIPRARLMEELGRPDETPELVLDLWRRTDASEDQASVAIGFTRDDLEQVLARSTGDEIVLTFDGAELTQAFDDVEAHGLRERALVFAVAFAGALGSSAAIANAARVPVTQLDGTQPAPPSATTTTQDTGGVGTDELLIGGAVLAIAGAAFAARRHTGSPRPA
jgi:hypothetical protein